MSSSRLEALALGLRRSPLGPVAALSGLTVRESVRKRVFLSIAAFAIVMLGATALLPAIDASDRVALVQTWAQRAITFFGVLITVLLAGVSLPDDIEERKIFTLLTKPLTRWQLLLGRFTGFASLLAVFAVSTGLLAIVFIRIVAGVSGGTLAPVSQFAASEVRIQGEDARSDITVRHSKSVPFFGTIKGDGKAVAIWYFHDVVASEFDEAARLRLDMAVAGSGGVQFGEFLVYLRPPQGVTEAKAASDLGWNVTFDGPILPGQPLPNRIASRTETIKSRVPLELRIPREWLSKGAIDVAIQRTKATTSVDIEPQGATLVTRPHGFEWNFTKGLISTFLMWMVVLSITVLGSTILTAPVNILFGAAVFIAGSMIGFIGESLPTVQERIVSVEQTARTIAAGGHSHGGGDDIPLPILRASQAISKAVIGVFPDFNKFDASEPMLRGLDIPLSRLGDSLKMALLYTSIALVAAAILLRMREFK